MFPSIYYLPEAMQQPQRCYDGMMIVTAIKGSLNIQVEGETLNNLAIHVVNEGELFKVNSSGIIIFYIPSHYWSIREQSVFNAHYTIESQQQEGLITDLNTLFNHLRDQAKALDIDALVGQIMKRLTLIEAPTYQHSNDLITRILHYVKENLHHKITLDELGQQFYVSPSYVSNLFKRHLAIKFNEYVSSLRVAKTIEDLVVEHYSVEQIANRWGYSSATKYITHFKTYMHTTPKKYTMKESTAHQFKIPHAIEDLRIINNLKFRKAKQTHQQSIVIDDDCIDDDHLSYFNLINIGGFDDLDGILDEQIYTYKNYTAHRLSAFVYISQTAPNAQRMIQGIKRLLKSKVPFALHIESVEEYRIVEETIRDFRILELETTSGDSLKSLKVLLLLDWKLKYLDSIEQFNSEIFGIQILTAIDLTDVYLFGHQQQLKQLSCLKTDYYTLDLKRLNKKQIITETESLAFLNHLKQFLSSIELPKSIIFLNQEAIKHEKVNAIANYIQKVVALRQHLAGVSVYFSYRQENQSDLAIFNDYETKTAYTFMSYMLPNFRETASYYGDHYILTKKNYAYNILLYNPSPVSTSTSSYDETLYALHMSDAAQQQSYIVSTETITDVEKGCLNSIISDNISSGQQLPTHLKYKLNKYNRPKLTVDYHDFQHEPYIVKAKANAVTLVTIYL
ncbi:helix-turn-helix transcriptional regulator [Staphylococcus pettenkoferi]|uniref:helix-turn-helix transcriptional regulator n=1 Tax=Staphylococcus pettenkoferi TaxID=170573 RepID=UPI000F54B9BE|nr:AraC family transcriptional regulator [Staphylococcus pettenkoferi]MCY1572353.1 helix-turn-helix domain-containing protein [Staphylococcus pettenkoferi]MCY1606284.1 helix-turn-helix domain-containing protein [Staphylococcus pettenkoferi]MDH9616796.1 AraC family transcriptional regulator [Staphylococcus pettenkoferi]RQM99325.1 hypothetical protein COR53_02415 [Staphylococcus pettenkoferi]